MAKLIITEFVVTDDADEEQFLLDLMRRPNVFTVTRLDQEN